MAIEVVDGSKLFMGGVLPNKSKANLADFAGIVWVEVGPLTSIGSLTSEVEMVTQRVLSDRVSRYAKGGITFPVMENAVIPDKTDPGQIAFAAAAADNCRTYAFKKESSTDCATSATVTMTIAAPGVVTWTAHGLVAGTAVTFSTTGALPAGLTAGVTYYVVSTGLTANAFSVAATPGGTAITTTGTQSGTHTATAQPIGETELFIGFAMPGGRSGGEGSSVVTRPIHIQPVCAAISV